MRALPAWRSGRWRCVPGGKHMKAWTGEPAAAVDLAEGHMAEAPGGTAQERSRTGAVTVDSARAAAQQTNAEAFAPPPCFFHRECGSRAEIEKQGKAVCRAC